MLEIFIVKSFQLKTRRTKYFFEVNTIANHRSIVTGMKIWYFSWTTESNFKSSACTFFTGTHTIVYDIYSTEHGLVNNMPVVDFYTRVWWPTKIILNGRVICGSHTRTSTFPSPDFAVIVNIFLINVMLYIRRRKFYDIFTSVPGVIIFFVYVCL